MVSLLRTAAAVSSALIRIASLVFLRWIPDHHFPPIIFTSLAVYLASLRSLIQRSTGDETAVGADADGDDNDKDATKSAVAKDPKPKTTRAGSGGSPVKTLLTGLPLVESPKLTVFTAFINVMLAAFTLDFLLRGLLLYPGDNVAFSRIGYVSPTTANLLVREPDPAQLPLVIHYQEAAENQGIWTEEGIIYTTDDTTDFAVPVKLKGLKPFTQYHYSLSNNMTGTFTTAPQSGTEAANRLAFVTSSCMKPNFPYNPLSHPLRIPGIEQMSTIVSKLPSFLRPSFMLFLGDFIYIDVPQRFGSSKSHYRSEYRRVYSSPSWSEPHDSPAINLPWLHTLDDHEIENDWSKGNLTSPYPAAADPFSHYHVSVNPPIPTPSFSKPDNTTYFSFIHGPASFFMLDTRTYRSEPSQADSTILGSAQLQSLLAYLARPEPAEVRWKIISSSVPFTKNWHVGTTDTWGGFLSERSTVLEAMWRAERDLGVRIVVLSGDRHEFGATRFPDPSMLSSSDNKDDTTPFTAGEGIHEFSVGPLSMFYLPVRTYRQTDNEDVSIKYVPDGRHKFGLIDIATYQEQVDDDDVSSGQKTSGTTIPCSVLTYSLYVDGNVIWKYRLSVPLASGGANGKKEPFRLPPGRVLLDEVESKEGLDRYLKTGIGRLEEVGFRLWREARDVCTEVLDRVGRSERSN